MTTALKTFLTLVIIHGGIFAILFAGFDYAEHKTFSVIHFLFRFIVFGIGMAFITTFVNRRSSQKIKKTV